MDSQIEFMIKALNVMDPAQSRCLRYVSAMIMSQRSNIKTLSTKKKRQSRRKQAKQEQDSYANVIRVQDLLDPLHHVFTRVSIRAKEDVQQSMLQLPVGSEPVRSQADIRFMVGSRPHVRRERNTMVRIGAGQ